jgi:predicted nucleic-acid-binding protein
MVILDANAILRYVLNDNKDQAEKAANAIESGSVTTVEILAEVVYVLSDVYNMPREEVSWLLHCILLDVQVDNLKALRYAAGVFNQTKLDFVDCLLVAYNKVYGMEVFSFDKKLNTTMRKELEIYQSE